ncbi:MAG TPA: FAD-dependent monooxygenase, partial [Rhodoblastus sp.]|nr:FAD-dependent monooxygenase [Rhodoblastus sp.]
MTSQEPFVIAGGGVGGLAAALALARIGRPSLLFERASAFREVGAGLQLSPNACRVLRGLGVLDVLLDLAIAPEYVRLRRGGDGKDLARVPLADAEKRWGAPYLAVHRADLLAALVDRARQDNLIQISNDSSLTGFIQDEKGVAVTYRFDGEFRRASGAALVAADGVRSLVRGRLIGGDSDKPAFTGHTA